MYADELLPGGRGGTTPPLLPYPPPTGTAGPELAPELAYPTPGIHPVPPSPKAALAALAPSTFAGPRARSGTVVVVVIVVVTSVIVVAAAAVATRYVDDTNVSVRHLGRSPLWLCSAGGRGATTAAPGAWLQVATTATVETATATAVVTTSTVTIPITTLVVIVIVTTPATSRHSHRLLGVAHNVGSQTVS